MRTKNFDEYLSEQLQDYDYRREYLLQLMTTVDDEEGLSLFDALKETVNTMGVTEFFRSCWNGKIRNFPVCCHRNICQKLKPSIVCWFRLV